MKITQETVRALINNQPSFIDIPEHFWIDLQWKKSNFHNFINENFKCLTINRLNIGEQLSQFQGESFNCQFYVSFSIFA
jgi:hypothetical protein